MKFEYRTDYFADAAARAEYIRFTREMHGVDLTAWAERGFWDHTNYRAFSFFEGDRIVSTASLYLLPMVIAGRRCVVPQLSGVGTLSGYRRRGLNGELTRRALAWCEGRTEAFRFLFADEEAFPFYARCGFRRVAQSRFEVATPPMSDCSRARLLDMDSDADLELLWETAQRRAVVSERIGCLSPNLLMFHALYTLRGKGYWLADLGVAVFAAVDGETLRVFDVVGPALPSLRELAGRLPLPTARRIEFMFMPDKLAPEAAALAADDPDGTHLGGVGFPYEGEAFRFPFTSRA